MLSMGALSEHTFLEVVEAFYINVRALTMSVIALHYLDTPRNGEKQRLDRPITELDT